MSGASNPGAQGRETAQPRRPRERIFLALRLLSVLPGRPTMTVRELADELEVSRKSVRRLIAEIREAGISLDEAFTGDDRGTKGYGVSGQTRAFLDRLLAERR